MVATRCVSQRLEQDVRAEEEAELYRLESGASAEKDVDEVPRRVLLALKCARTCTCTCARNKLAVTRS